MYSVHHSVIFRRASNRFWTSLPASTLLATFRDNSPPVRSALAFLAECGSTRSAVDTPSQKMPAGQFRPVVATDRRRLSALGNDSHWHKIKLSEYTIKIVSPRPSPTEQWAKLSGRTLLARGGGCLTGEISTFSSRSLATEPPSRLVCRFSTRIQRLSVVSRR